MPDRQITFAPHGHLLTNTAVWSPDGQKIVYDVRSDADGSVFDGTRIETVNVDSGTVEVVYESRNGACCGVATWHPLDPVVAFIRGPEFPATNWTYGATRRQGVLVDVRRPAVATHLDARDLTPPFTAGALRGGSHVHVFSPDGTRVSFTYEDYVLSRFDRPGDDHDLNRRTVAVSVVGRPVLVPRHHPRNHDGTAFTVLAVRPSSEAAPGTDQFQRAYEEGWIGSHGYRRGDGVWQKYALAFLGDVRNADGNVFTEVFVADLPDDPTVPGEGPLEGTDRRLPFPPAGTTVRRLTRTADRRHPGVQGVRHWVRSSPDGQRVAFLMRDAGGIVQLHTAPTVGGDAQALTRNPHDITSAFTWSVDGRLLAHTMDGSVCVTDSESGHTRRLTPPVDPADGPLSLACVFSPDGRRIAYQRQVPHRDGRQYNQVFVVDVT